jgi:HTH-type transcriptional regulator / antitoxin HipB
MDAFIFTSQQLAKTLKSRHKALKLTQKEAASLVGLLPKTVSALESDPDRCSLESLRKLLAALRLELAIAPKAEAADPDRKAEW